MVNGKISNTMCLIVLFAAILGSVILLGCVSKELPEKVISEENIGGKYNAKLVILESPVDEQYRRSYGKDYYEDKAIQYSIGDKQFQGSYLPDFWAPATDSIDWIKRNTSENSIFLNWWDYGHTIRGATGRDIVIASTSKEGSKYIAMIGKMITEKTFEEKYGFETQEKVEDVGTALTTDNIEITNQIMDKYNAKYIYTTMRDLDIIHTMKEGDFETIVDTPQGQQTVPSKRFYESTLVKLQLFKGKNLKNYRLVYESEPNLQSNEKHYKNVYNILYGGNITSEDSGYIKIFEYIKN
jgi:asparagine N-glycosylation enzyme membrane subunit Stt3/outer membrane murein-binding lipoprotein Lpp